MRWNDRKVFTISFILLPAHSKATLSTYPFHLNNHTFAIKFLNSSSTYRCRSKRIQNCCSELLQSAPDTTSPWHIMNALPDELLLRIFESMHLIDLCAAADVCTHFNRLATSIFTSRYKNRQFEFEELRYKSIDCLSLSLIEQCLRAFGSSMHSLTTSMYRLNRGIVARMVAEYCTNLTELDISRVRTIDIEPETMVAVRPILAKLTKLSINGWVIANEYRDNEWQLERLFISGHFDAPQMPTIRTPKLIQFGLFKYVDLICASLLDFLTTRQHIEEFILCNCVLSLDDLYILSETRPNFKVLTIVDGDLFGDDCQLNDSDAFKCLKHFNLFGVSKLVVKQGVLLLKHLANKAEIEQLQLRWIFDENLMDYICQMVSINTLFLEYVRPRFDDRALIRIIHALKRLESAVINTADVGLACIRRALEEGTQITKFEIRLSRKKRINIDELECRLLEELIDTRPRLCVRVEVEQTNVDVSRSISQSHYNGTVF